MARLEADRPIHDPGKLHEYLKKHRITRLSANLGWKVAVYLKTLNDPERRKTLKDRESMVGLLEDSIFAPKLYFPDDDETSIVWEQAPAGRYVGYDFWRPMEFGASVRDKDRQCQTGRLWTFPLPEVINNSPNEHTSSYLFNPLLFEHVIYAELPTISDLLRYGFIEEVSYKEAYSKAAQYDKFAEDLAKEGIEDQNVYRDTPKGNTLVHLLPDMGEKDPKKDEVSERARGMLRPAFGFP